MPDYDRTALRLHDGISAIGREAWNALTPDGHPFTRHEFLSALEDAGCVGGGAGWRPLHLTLHSADGTLRGALPLYLKGHSLGEYVFDQSWAEAYEAAGGRYYPKLLAAIPFTPCAGPRLLAADPAAKRALVQNALTLCGEMRLSSLHFNFTAPPDSGLLGEMGLLERRGIQFHWRNEGYGCFEDFLSAFSSQKRKAVRKERQAVANSGITVDILTGADIREEHWDHFYRFYLDTGSRKWGRPYLNRRFFSLLGERMADALVLILAKRENRYIAGALNLSGSGALYGRYWGAIENHPFLHFELCYYQAIDYAIRHRLGSVEAGAQGEHKIARGYLPVETRSYHHIGDPAFRQAIARYLVMERGEISKEAVLLADRSPYRRVPL